MKAYQPFVGEHAEYYRRRTLRDATTLRVQTENAVLENHFLRKQIAELEHERELLFRQLTLSEKSAKPPRGFFARLVRWFKNLF